MINQFNLQPLVADGLSIVPIPKFNTESGFPPDEDTLSHFFSLITNNIITPRITTNTPITANTILNKFIFLTKKNTTASKIMIIPTTISVY